MVTTTENVKAYREGPDWGLGGGGGNTNTCQPTTGYVEVVGSWGSFLFCPLEICIMCACLTLKDERRKKNWQSGWRRGTSKKDTETPPKCRRPWCTQTPIWSFTDTYQILVAFPFSFLMHLTWAVSVGSVNGHLYVPLYFEGVSSVSHFPGSTKKNVCTIFKGKRHLKVWWTYIMIHHYYPARDHQHIQEDRFNQDIQTKLHGKQF